METVLVLGATGTVGRYVLRALAERGVQVTGASRAPASGSNRAGTPVPFVEFNYDRPETFSNGLKNVSRVFMTVRPGDEHADVTGLPFVEAMARQKVEQVVLLSAMGAELRSDFALRKIELAIEASGMQFTLLRPNWFMQVFTGKSLLEGIKTRGVIALPAGQAKISYIDARDVADVAVDALVDPSYSGKGYTLTGPQALTHDDIAATLTTVLGRPVRYLAIEESQARLALEQAGFPEEWVERLIGFYRLVRQGWCAPVVQEMPSLLKHSPREFATFASEHAECWR